MEQRFVKITDEFITLGQLLKHLSIIGSGGMAKWYLMEYDVYVDGELENRRGKKLFHNTTVELPNESISIIIQVESLSL